MAENRCETFSPNPTFHWSSASGSVRSAQSRQVSPVWREKERHPVIASLTISRKLGRTSGDSKYRNSVPSSKLINRLPSPPDNRRPRVSAATTEPRRENWKDGAKGSPLVNTTCISADSSFHLFRSRIASSSEELIILGVAETIGIAEAFRIAEGFNWRLGARFYAALLASASNSSKSHR